MGSHSIKALETWADEKIQDSGKTTKNGSTLGRYPKKTIIQKDPCTAVFTAALFTIARTWKQPRFPLTEEWIKKMWYIHIVEYFSATKMSKIVSLTELWMY